MNLLCLYYVTKTHGPWQRGWWVAWDMLNPCTPIVAMLNPSDAGSVVDSWGPDHLHELFAAVYVADAVRLEWASSGVADQSIRQLQNATDYSGAAVKIA